MLIENSKFVKLSVVLDYIDFKRKLIGKELDSILHDSDVTDYDYYNDFDSVIKRGSYRAYSSLLDDLKVLFDYVEKRDK